MSSHKEPWLSSVSGLLGGFPEPFLINRCFRSKNNQRDDDRILLTRQDEVRIEVECLHATQTRGICSFIRLRSPAPRRFDGLKISAHSLMADERVRRQIAHLAAQMMYQRTESEYFTAKRKAARQLWSRMPVSTSRLPSNKEIRDEIQMVARLTKDQDASHLRDMRIEALRCVQACPVQTAA